MNTTHRIRTRIEVAPTNRFPGYLALVWVTTPGHGPQVYQVYCGPVQNVVYRAAQEYATAVVYGRVEAQHENAN